MNTLIDSNNLNSGLPKWRSYRAMRKFIDDGSWRPGERILGEEHLAKSLGVSRMTVRSALGILEEEGLIEGLGRKGRFVSDRLKIAPGIFNDAVVLITSNPEIIGPSVYDGWMHAVDSGIIHGASEAKLPFMILPQSNFEHFGGKSLLKSRPVGIAITDELDVSGTFLREIGNVIDGEVPVVVSNHNDAFSSFDRVFADQEAGAGKLARYLIGRGCRKILHVLPNLEGSNWVRQRISGCRNALKGAGIESGMEFLHKHKITRAGNADEFEEQARMLVGILVEYLKNPSGVDAIMCTNDVDAFYMAGACRLFGRTPGKDIMIAGFDNMWRDCRESKFIDFKPVATIDKRNHETGMKILEVILARKRGLLPPEPQTCMMDPRLIIT